MDYLQYKYITDIELEHGGIHFGHQATYML